MGRGSDNGALAQRTRFPKGFQSAEECFSPAFEQGLAWLCEVVEEAAGRDERWLDRVRAGLLALLGFLDDAPEWGRLLVLEASAVGTASFECGQRVRGVLAGLLNDRSPRAVARGQLTPSPDLTAELVLGGVFSVIRVRMSDPEGDGGPLVELAPRLMSFIAVAYLGQAGASAAVAGGYAAAAQAPALVADCPAPPPVPVSRRTTLVLSAIACEPRSSNREIAAAAGLADEGQTSHLLRRLAQRGLIEKVRPRSGSRRENAWLLTPSGRRVIELLGLDSSERAQVSAAARARQVAESRESCVQPHGLFGATSHEVCDGAVERASV